MPAMLTLSDPVSLAVLLVIAGICGAIGQSLAGYNLGGCLVSILVGFVGAWLGGWIAAQVGLPPIFSLSFRGQTFPIVWSVLGSFVLSLVIGWVQRGSRRL